MTAQPLHEQGRHMQILHTNRPHVAAIGYAKMHADAKSGAKNPFNERMQKHCKALATDADELAADAEKAAEFHSLRAKELQGK